MSEELLVIAQFKVHAQWQIKYATLQEVVQVFNSTIIPTKIFQFIPISIVINIFMDFINCYSFQDAT